MKLVPAFFLFCLCILLLLPSNSNAQWVQTNSPTSVSYFAVRDTSIFVTGGSPTGLLVSSVHSTIWTEKNSGFPTLGAFRPFVYGSKVYVGTVSHGLYVTTDDGNDWTQVGLNTYNVDDEGYVDGVLVAGVQTAIQRSTDNGATWGPQIILNASTTFLRTYDDTMFCGADAKLFRSVDSAKTWVRKDSGLGGSNVKSLAKIGTTLFVSTYGNGVYRSTNNGDTWSAADTGFTGNFVAYVNGLVAYNGNLFAATYAGVFVSTDMGDHWASFGTGLPTNAPGDITVCSGYLYVCESNGAWRLNLSDLLAVHENTDAIPQTYALEQNFPNPFNPTTQIGFRTAGFGSVTLKIYDALGREIATVLNHEKLTAGEHQVPFDASHLSSGVYFYRLTVAAGGGGKFFTDVKKMMLIQ